jgi:hypothetical protein
MNPSPVTVSQTKATNLPRIAHETLPQWEHLSAKHRRELILTLAAMVIRQLPAHLWPQGVGDEATS